MKVLMLGWEYPPNISGGLGTACEGLTKALASKGIDIDFVLPKKLGGEHAPHMDLLEPEELAEQIEMETVEEAAPGEGEAGTQAGPSDEQKKAAAKKAAANYAWVGAYARPIRTAAGNLDYTKWKEETATAQGRISRMEPRQAMGEILQASKVEGENNLFTQVEHFTKRVENASLVQKFDVVHAHDWLTFPAGVIAARAARVPLISHVHSLEVDRAGEGGNPVIHAIEGVGIRAADHIVAVSEYTRDQIVRVFGIPKDRISVAHNGVDPTPHGTFTTLMVEKDKPRVLFLGRVTFQKGPDYFIEAASLVARKLKDAVFVMAGSGDMLHWARQRVHELGLEDRFEFPGFVKGDDLEQEFRRASVFVMPSVSEPFGIVALEAIHRGTPTIVSKQSGVSEVLRHVFKVDFWDTWRMADLIVNLLQYPELGKSLRTNAEKEVSRLGWDSTADRVGEVYSEVVNRELPFIL
jgi:glycosyltransferase involved in cell wall biosynthesis